ncbi:MAG: response regulator [Deltaproteobacteria bacterium]|nr:response regulator [Deltaproteobacteria bacterium]
MAEKGTILVIDNESDQLEMMKEILGRIGFDAKTTDNPQQALAMVEKQAFSLIFIDLIMSEIDGMDLCEQIKQVRPSVCVYAFSGHAHLYSPERLERAGFDGAIGKPATMEEIKAVLSRTMDTPI